MEEAEEEAATEALWLSSAQQPAAQEDAPQVRKAGEEAAGKGEVEEVGEEAEVEAGVRLLPAGSERAWVWEVPTLRWLIRGTPSLLCPAPRGGRPQDLHLLHLP